MPVAIKAHLHNVCAKNNYELLIARRSPKKKLRATELGGGEGNDCEMSAHVCRRRDNTQEDGTDPSRGVCTHQAVISISNMKLSFFCCFGAASFHPRC